MILRSYLSLDEPTDDWEEHAIQVEVPEGASNFDAIEGEGNAGHREI